MLLAQKLAYIKYISLLVLDLIGVSVSLGGGVHLPFHSYSAILGGRLFLWVK